MVRTESPAESGKESTRKPAGGYRLIAVTSLCMAWSAYRAKVITFGDLRAYFALHEMASRRCMMKKDRLPRFTHEELAELLVHRGTAHARAAVRRLTHAGLLDYQTTSVRFFADPANLAESLQQFGTAMIAGVTNNRRLVPVPRRTLRLLATTSGPAVTATILSHLFRCVYRRDGTIASVGACKASWVANLFGIDLRNIKRARAKLEAINWLSVESCDHWRKQRYGQRVIVNMDWRPTSRSISRPLAGSPSSTTIKQCSTVSVANPPPPPRERRIDPLPPPPDSDKELLIGLNNQELPAAGNRPAGIQERSREPRSSPSWRHVEPSDLTDIRRLLELYRQATTMGLAHRSEAARLDFVAAAERALAKGTGNQVGFFVQLVRQRLWHHLTHDDEDRARLRLARLLNDEPACKADVVSARKATPQAREAVPGGRGGSRAGRGLVPALAGKHVDNECVRREMSFAAFTPTFLMSCECHSTL